MKSKRIVFYTFRIYKTIDKNYLPFLIIGSVNFVNLKFYFLKSPIRSKDESQMKFFLSVQFNIALILLEFIRNNRKRCFIIEKFANVNIYNHNSMLSELKAVNDVQYFQDLSIELFFIDLQEVQYLWNFKCF